MSRRPLQHRHSFGFRRGKLGGGTSPFGLMRCVGLGISPYMSYALALDFANGEYWVGGTQYDTAPNLPGYSYSRTGAVSFVKADELTYGPEQLPQAAAGWTTGSGAALSDIGGAIRLTQTTNDYGYMTYAVSTAVGQRYSLHLSAAHADIQVRAGYAQGQDNSYGSNLSAGNVLATTFVARDATTYITFTNLTPTSGTYFEVSAISLKAVYNHRSYGPELTPAFSAWTKAAGATLNGTKLVCGQAQFDTADASLGAQAAAAVFEVTIDVESLGDSQTRWSVGPNWSIGRYSAGVLTAGLNTFQFTMLEAETPHIWLQNFAVPTSGAVIKSVSTKQVFYDAIDDFPANVPPILSGKGYEAYGAVTNLLTYSQDFSNAAWVPLADGTGTGAAPSPTANQGLAPDGTLSADAVSIPARSADTRRQILYHEFTGTAVPHTSTLWVKAKGAADAGQKIVVNLWDSLVGTDAVVTLTNEWQAVPIVRTLTASATCNLSFGRSSATSDLGAVEFLVWQGQVLPGNFPDGGPIIATAGSAVTVGAPTFRMNSPAIADVDQLITFRMKQNMDAATYAYPFAFNLNDSIATDYLMVYSGYTGPFYWHCAILAGGVAVFDQQTTGLDTPTYKGQEVTLVLRRLNGKWRFGFYFNGTLTWAGADTTAAVPNVNRLQLGNTIAGDGPLYGEIELPTIKQGTFANDAAVIAALPA